MRALRFLMAGLLVAGVVVMADAQPGGGFGRGGFGAGPAQLVQNEEVQKDLKLTDEQTEKLKTWAKDFQTKQSENMKGKFADLKDATKEERTEKFAAWGVEARTAAYKDLADVLKPEQVARLKQIEIQASGIRAYQNEETAASLKLTDSQKGKIKTIVGDFQKDSQDLFPSRKGGGGGGGFDKEKMAENLAKRQKLEKAAIADIEETLTDDQKKVWKDLTGAPIDRSKLNQFGGGGRGKGKAKD